MCMCGGGAHGYGTTCQWCGIGNGVPDNFALQLALAQRDVARRDRVHDIEMRKIWGDRWDPVRGTVKNK